jgi:hypothetical protein
MRSVARAYRESAGDPIGRTRVKGNVAFVDAPAAKPRFSPRSGGYGDAGEFGAAARNEILAPCPRWLDPPSTSTGAILTQYAVDLERCRGQALYRGC